MSAAAIPLVGEAVLSLAIVVAVLMVFIPTGMRCRECGSIQLTKILVGFPIWICDSCQNVFRVPEKGRFG
jgi:ribosomal protein L37AE/L43A